MNLKAAEDLAKYFEGLHRVKNNMIYPYTCPAGYPTQGWGTVYKPDGTKVKLTDPPITRETSDLWLEIELKICANSVKRLCPELYMWSLKNANWNPFCSIVDFVYNLGAGRLQTSTLRKKLKVLDWVGAQQEIEKWVWAGGVILPGLKKRRKMNSLLLNI